MRTCEAKRYEGSHLPFQKCALLPIRWEKAVILAYMTSIFIDCDNVEAESANAWRRKMADKWMQEVHPKKGALHRELGIPMGKKIPGKKLEKAAHSKNPLLKKRAVLAETYRKARRSSADK